MLTRQRKDHILAVLKRDGQVIAKALSQELDLSEDTIRRDLRELAAEGRLQRVHGGALPASPAVANLAARERISPGPKIAIGRAAAKLVRRGQIIFLDGGTTALQLVRHLPLDLTATVITHSPSIAVSLIDHAAVEVVMIGGRLFKHSMVNVGVAALDAISRVQVDTYFMGATGIHPQNGVTTGDFEEAELKRAIMVRAAETIVLATADKLNAVSPFVIAPLAELSGVVLDGPPGKSFAAACAKAGVSITLA